MAISEERQQEPTLLDLVGGCNAITAITELLFKKVGR